MGPHQGPHRCQSPLKCGQIASRPNRFGKSPQRHHLTVTGYNHTVFTDSHPPTVAPDDFARRFSMRGSSLMWLLGAGASAAAGVPTAGDMIWEFKQQLYVSQRRVSPKIVADLANPSVQRELQSFIDGQGRYPPQYDPNEYAALFEAAYPNEVDRRTYIAAKLAAARPSYGHIALATLMKSERARLVWTTNFDPLIADACAKVYDGTGALTTVALDAPDHGTQVLNEELWPAEIKLHGDFRSRRLKNTTSELQQQDARLRTLLVNACGRSGLIVAGYSGRDGSIMAALEDALDQSSPFPSGLFWLHRGDVPSFPQVASLLHRAAAKGIDGGMVTIENFDECLRDLVRLIEGLDTQFLDTFAANRNVVSYAPRPTGNHGFPVIRLNALEFKTIPSVCRKIDCSIGGSAAVAEAIQTANVDVLATRTRHGVLAFGSDVDIQSAFALYGIKEFDLHPIEVARLRYDSQERGLLRRAFSRALARSSGLTAMTRRSIDLLSPSRPSDTLWNPLRKLVGNISGGVPNCQELEWFEGLAIRLAWADDRLWALFEPRTVFSGIAPENRHIAAGFARERTVRRYNRYVNDLLSFWAQQLSASGGDLRALEVSAGVDAVFRLGINTAYSRRASQ